MKSIIKLLWRKINQPRIWLIFPFVLLTVFLVIIPLVIVLVFAFVPGGTNTVHNNFEIIDQTAGVAIWRSLWTSIITTIICLLIAYPFSYFLSFSKSVIFKTIIIVIATSPIWSSFLIKVIGLKSLLDLLNARQNSTFGDGYTLLGLIYIYLPFSIIPIYTVLDNMPRNIIYASNDLGQNNFQTFFKVVIPYSINGMLSATVLVFLPSFTTVAVAEFLNNNNDALGVGSLVNDQGLEGLDSPVALARSSALSLIISLIMFLVYGLIVLTPKVWSIMIAPNKKIALKNWFCFFRSVNWNKKNFN